MAQQGIWSRRRNAAFFVKTCDLRFFLCHLPEHHFIKQSKITIGATQYIPTWTNFHFLVGILSILFIIQQWSTSPNSSSAALSFGPFRLVLSAQYHRQSSLLVARSRIRVMQWSIRGSHSSRPAPCMLLILMDWAISQTCSLSSLSFRCVVKPPFSCQILWANSLTVHIEVNVIDDRADISLELTNPRVSCRAALMPQSRT